MCVCVCVLMCVTVGFCREQGHVVPTGSRIVLSLLRETRNVFLVVVVVVDAERLVASCRAAELDDPPEWCVDIVDFEGPGDESPVEAAAEIIVAYLARGETWRGEQRSEGVGHPVLISNACDTLPCGCCEGVVDGWADCARADCRCHT